MLATLSQAATARIFGRRRPDNLGQAPAAMPHDRAMTPTERRDPKAGGHLDFRSGQFSVARIGIPTIMPISAPGAAATAASLAGRYHRPAAPCRIRSTGAASARFFGLMAEAVANVATVSRARAGQRAIASPQRQRPLAYPTAHAVSYPARGFGRR